MIKIKEIHAHNYNTPCRLRDRGACSVENANKEWIETVLTKSQILFLKKNNGMFRRHPKRYTTVEIFIDEQSIDSKQITMLHLLF